MGGQKSILVIPRPLRIDSFDFEKKKIIIIIIKKTLIPPHPYQAQYLTSQVGRKNKGWMGCLAVT